MTKAVIEVQGLSKQYRLGSKVKNTQTFSGQIVDALKAPMRNFRRLTNLSKFTSDEESIFWALRDVNFSVHQGEILGIIGRNGAGKSTLLKILSRITEPTSGTVTIKGRVASLLEVGTGFHPELTGRENIYMNGTILGMTKKEIDGKLEEIIDFSGVEKFLDTPVKFYSSGMKVRLGFSVAAHLDPEILIIDEVLAVGDYEFQKKCLRKMETVAGQGRTVLFVSHSMGSVKSLCSRAVILKNGTKELEGKVDEMISSYLNGNLESEDNIKLCDRTDRSGDGRARITSIRIVDNLSNLEISQVLSGACVSFEIDFEMLDDYSKNNLIEIGLAFFDSQHRFVTVLNNVMANAPLYITDRKAVIACELKKLPLMSGKYYVRSMIKLNGELSDIVENALVLFVNEGDFYNSGKSNALGRQGIYIEQHWKC